MFGFTYFEGKLSATNLHTTAQRQICNFLITENFYEETKFAKVQSGKLQKISDFIQIWLGKFNLRFKLLPSSALNFSFSCAERVFDLDFHPHPPTYPVNVVSRPHITK